MCRATRFLLVLPLSLGACGSDEEGGRDGFSPPGADDGGDGGSATGGDDDGATGGGDDGATGGDDGDGDEGGDDGDDGSDDGGVKFDLSEPDDDGGCADDNGEVESYIWIANSTQGTVSKIDTRALLELGRYQVRPDGAGNPSRTSVNRENDMVVLSRHGGLTKIWGDLKRCQESNGQGGIQTSSGNGEVLPWDEEECRAWHTPLSYDNMRAVAWTSGEYNEETCEYANQKVWVGGNMTNVPGSADVLLVDGDTGAIEQTIELPEDLPLPIGHGPYGAAVDSENNMWIVQVYDNWLIRVDFQDYSLQIWDEPQHTYGMSIDSDGLIWICNRHVGSFDPTTETWNVAMIEDWQGYHGHAGGCMNDNEGLIWKSMNDRLLAVDTDTLTVSDTITLPEGMLWGVAIDYDGFVWAIPRSGTTAYRVDPDSHDIQSVGGLVGAYTYSDMTGFLLHGVAPG
jgi:streptogramin lyase